MENIFLRPQREISEIYVPPEACKNDSRPRKIALNEVASWVVGKVYERAINLGSTNSEHYLFPFRIKRCKYNPERQATRWLLRCSWNDLREISLPICGLMISGTTPLLACSKTALTAIW